MIKLIVKFRIRKGEEEAYLRELKPCILAARQEPENLDYTAFWNEEENIMTLFECYPDEAALEAHLQYPHYTKNFLALQRYYDGDVLIERYDNPIV